MTNAHECGFVTYNERTGINCQRDCSARIIIPGKRDRTEINADAARAVRGLTRDIRMATWAVIGTIAFIAAIAPQGVENIRAAQIANMEP